MNYRTQQHHLDYFDNLKMREQRATRDKVLWILGSSGGEMNSSRLRSMKGLKKSYLDIILAELERGIGLLFDINQ